MEYILGALLGFIAATLAARLVRPRTTPQVVEQPVPPISPLPPSKHADENERLKQELRAYSSMLNTLDFPVWRRGKELSIKYCNLAFSEAAEEEVEKVIHGDELELYRNARPLAVAAQSDNAHRRERRHIVVDGKRRWYEINEVPLPDIGGTVGYAIDITELEQTQEEMQRHISAQADLLESSTSAMAIYGPDMRLVLYNNAFVRTWRLDEAWLDEKPAYGEVLEKLRENRKLPEQANFPAFKQQQLKLFTSLIDPHEELLYLPDGKTFRIIIIPHAMGGLLFAYEDVTDRLALERSYNTLIAVQKETLNRLHEGVAVFAENGRLKLSNPTYLKLWNLDETFTVNEPHYSDVLERTRHYYHGKNWESLKEQLLAQSHTRSFGYQRLERTDGSVIDCSTVPLPDGATLFTFYDVTDTTLVERSLREKNEALEEADRLKTEFLANISYELRSPLTSISGFTEMLKQNYFGDLTDKQREYVEAIHHASHHLMSLINDILDLATIEAGYMRLEVSRIGIYRMLSNVLSLVKERARDLDIRLAFKCSNRIGSMLADETRIKQALFNLLSNALKYTARGGEITLGAADHGIGEVKIWVEDTGVGVVPDEQYAIFGKFYKGASGGQKPGTGLGLPVVKSFIELHGGRIELDSTPNVGTRITCYLQRNNPNLEQYIANPE